MSTPSTRSKTDSLNNLLNQPWVMVLLAITLLLGQFLNNGHTPQPVLQWYQSSGLKTLEWENYLSWLRLKGNGELARQLEQQVDSGNPHAYSAALYADDFAKDSDQRALDFWTPAQAQQWKALRGEIPAQLAASPLYQWGLSEARPRPAQLFTAPFTGASPWLLLATLLLLAPLTAALEKQLGHGRLIALWLAGSVLSGAGYLLVANVGQAPAHGAGPMLMVFFGAFLGCHRGPLTLHYWHPKQKSWQPLQLPLPLLLLLPAVALALLVLLSTPWLPALIAAVVSLIGGALLVQVMQPTPEQESSDSEEPEQDAETQSWLNQGWQALGALDGESARHAFSQALEQHPEDFDALSGLFAALQLDDPQQQWPTIAQRLFSHPAPHTGQPQQIAQCWQQYRQRKGPGLPVGCGWRLVKTLTRARLLPQAEVLAKQLGDDDEKALAIELLRSTLMAEGLEQRAKSLPG